MWVSYICITLIHCNIFRYCGTETPSGPIISIDNQMLIVFQTNYTIPEGVVFTQTGFKAELSITSGKCNQCVKVIDFIKCFGCSNVEKNDNFHGCYTKNKYNSTTYIFSNNTWILFFRRVYSSSVYKDKINNHNNYFHHCDNYYLAHQNHYNSRKYCTRYRMPMKILTFLYFLYFLKSMKSLWTRLFSPNRNLYLHLIGL